MNYLPLSPLLRFMFCVSLVFREEDLTKSASGNEF